MQVNGFVIFAALCAYFVKGVCGFANTVVLTSILSFRSDNIQITPIDLLLGIPANIVMAYKERKAVKLRLWLPLATLVVVGSIPGIFFLKLGNSKSIKVVLGITIVVIGLEMLFREFHTKSQALPRWILWLIGLISGFISGVFGIGALLAAYMGRTTETGDSFRGNLCMVLLTDNLFRLIVYLIMGIMTTEAVKAAAILFPFMLIGLGLGAWARRKLDEKKVKFCVVLMLMLSGISLVISNI